MPSSENENFALIDVSYYKKHSAHAAWRKYKSNFAKEDDPMFDPMLDQEYVDMLQGYFAFTLPQIMTRHYPFQSAKNIIFCIDCPRDEIWRKTFYPAYKQNRDNIQPKFKFDSINSWVDTWVRMHNAQHGSKTISISSAEADDIIAILSKSIVKSKPNCDVLIVSGDSDLMQLHNDRVCQIDAKGDLQTIQNKLMKENVEFTVNTKNYLIYKILTGDTSDGIPSVKYGKCGPKKASELIRDNNVGNFIKSSADVTEAFRRNHMLISLDNIPRHIVESVYKIYASML